MSIFTHRREKLGKNFKKLKLLENAAFQGKNATVGYIPRYCVLNLRQKKFPIENLFLTSKKFTLVLLKKINHRGIHFYNPFVISLIKTAGT